MNTPKQLTYLNSSLVGSNPSDITDVNGVIYFTADDGRSGRELWKLQANGNPPIRVSDINFGFASANPENLTVVNGTLYFTADNGKQGRELWKISNTGTPELIEDINLGANSANPDNLTVFNNTLYFIADDEKYGKELWKLDSFGKPQVVQEISLYSQSSHPTNLTIFNEALYFTLTDKSDKIQLWRTTTTGITEQVNNIASNLFNFSNFNVVNNTLFFTAQDRYNNVILLKIDNQGNTQPITGINSNFYNLSNMTAINNTLYFSTTDYNRSYLWKIDSNGNAQQLNNYGSLANLSNISNLVVVNDILYFSGIDRYNGLKIWQIDHNGNSKQVLGTFSSYSNLSNFTVVNDILYFISDNSLLWKIDNAYANRINGIAPSSSISNLTVANNTLYFNLTDRYNDSKLAKINNNGYVETVRSINPISNPSNLQIINDTVYFTANDGNNGNELWKLRNEFDHTETAVRVSQINRNTRQAPGDFINVNGTLYFTAETKDKGRELWRINNGVPELVQDINLGNRSSNLENLTVFNDILYFTVQTEDKGRELWRINNNGVPLLVKDIILGNRSSNPENLTVVNDILYFTATDDRNKIQLLKIDNQGNLNSVRFINFSSSNYPTFTLQNLTNINDTLYFVAGEENAGKLWRINQIGDAEMVRDSSSTYPAFNPENLTFIDNTLFFTADDGRYGKELWKINQQGYSQRISDINPSESSSNPENLTVVNGTLYFTATNSYGTELWRINSDGNPQTITVKDIFYGAESSNSSNLTVVKDALYFTADEGSNRRGRELWKIDNRGYVTLVKDINPGNLSSNPENLIVVNDTLYFTATDNIGKKLWWIDNSNGQVKPVVNISSEFSNFSNFTNINDTFYFTATDTVSRKLWKIESNGNAIFVNDINRNSGFSEDFNLTAIDNKLYFVKDDGLDGSQVWVLENQSPEIKLSSYIANFKEINSFNNYSQPQFIEPNAIILDRDSDNFNKGKLTVRITNGGHPDDRLSIHGNSNIVLDGRIVKYQNIEIGILTPSYGVEDMVIDFNANATRPIVEQLLRRVSYTNFSRNPSTNPRTVELIISDGDGGTSEVVSKIVNVQPVNDAPFIGKNQLLYDSSTNLDPINPNSTPNGSWFEYQQFGLNVNKTLVDGGIKLTSGNQAYAGFNTRTIPPLNKNEGYILSFNLQLLSEDHTSYGNTDKNGDGKADRAGFSVTLLGSSSEGIELGFWENRIWVQQDGVFNPGTSQAADITNPYLTLFTQVEGVDFDTTKSVNYDLAIFGYNYTLYADNKSILSGRLRNYSAYKPTTEPDKFFPNPYSKTNFIFFGDNNPYAGAEVKLGDISLTTHSKYLSPSPNNIVTYQENNSGVVIDSQIILTDLDSPNFANGRLTVRLISGISNQDILSINNQGNGTGQINVSGDSILFESNLIGTFKGGFDNIPLEINFTSKATPKAVETLMRNITYANNSDRPLTHYRQIEFVLNEANFNGTSKPVVREIRIQSINDIPIVENPIANQTIAEDTIFNFSIPNNTFKDLDADKLTLNATLSDNSPLPTWLIFNPETATFSGTPKNNHVGVINIKVTARDNAGESTASIFSLTVENVNNIPIINANQSFSLNENSRAGTFVGRVIATDANKDILSNWTITNGNLDLDGDGKAAFTINSTTGRIIVNDADDLDFESNPSFELQLTVSDGISISENQSVTINLNNLDGLTIEGTTEIDRLRGTQEDDIIDGGAGNDFLYGNRGNDTLIGGSGNDNLYGGEGDDFIDGGDGIDTLRENADVDFILIDNQLIGVGTDTLVNIERAALTGGESANKIDAANFSGIVYLYGRGGNDTLIGGSGNDNLYGGEGDDLINSGAGNDRLYGEGGSDIFVISSLKGRDTIYDFEDGIDTLGLSDSLTF
ncbi:MAG: putative Ig domain-containing protein, partial [Rivularia sp. (in: cyanobacteria)]